jgi:hypothetical protein
MTPGNRPPIAVRRKAMIETSIAREHRPDFKESP